MKFRLGEHTTTTTTVAPTTTETTTTTTTSTTTTTTTTTTSSYFRARNFKHKSLARFYKARFVLRSGSSSIIHFIETVLVYLFLKSFYDFIEKQTFTDILLNDKKKML